MNNYWEKDTFFVKKKENYVTTILIYLSSITSSIYSSVIVDVIIK